ncbi:aldose epimerase family protein [Caproiciproducens sp. CPB-2]|uniref:aldose epimerase family protein n=1 Tax=Caproiciproducens sp. CPB-2 TaxID=3030017 RepID=UPI0023DBAB59|nr:aldose epimerase family protein [Caproiciproducens sp. CPB-2]MDF1495348.1 galactose mutarotase [Caproiciproducens sp. CPB-2]
MGFCFSKLRNYLKKLLFSQFRIAFRTGICKLKWRRKREGGACPIFTHITQYSKDSRADHPVYCLKNDLGTEVGFVALGAAIAFVKTPDRNGHLINIALSLCSYEEYSRSDTYSGATIGPAAGRIRNGLLPILGTEYSLQKNDSGNTLHGGTNNLGHSLWEIGEFFCGPDEAGIVFKARLNDGQNGFPGERHFGVRYTLSSDNTLKIRYTAVTDKTTFLNLTNHTYWNLTGDFTKPCDSIVLQINAEEVYFNDADHLPVSCESTVGTPFDFTSPRPVAEAMKSAPAHSQLQNARGYNNAYVLRDACLPAASLYDPKSGRHVTVATDYPCLVFYSGGYLSEAGFTADGQKIAAGSAYALEAQYPPDAPNLLGKDAPLLFPGDVYHKEISFHFDTL